MGYVGIGYSGNTVNAALPRGQTIDDVLEDALFDAGCVLLSNYRSRALSRLKWSRSSRTVRLFLVIFGYFWLFLAIFGYFWLFLVILVIACTWAIRLTAFYLLTGQRRVVARHRRVRAA